MSRSEAGSLASEVTVERALVRALTKSRHCGRVKLRRIFEMVFSGRRCILEGVC